MDQHNAIYSHDLQRARLYRLAGSVTDFARRGLVRDLGIFREDETLPPLYQGSKNVRRLLMALTRAATREGLPMAQLISSRHRGVSCVLDTAGLSVRPSEKPHRVILKMAAQERLFKDWPTSRSVLQRTLPRDGPLGRWTVIATLTPQPPDPWLGVSSAYSDGGTDLMWPIGSKTTDAWLVLTEAGPLIAYWPETAYRCRLADNLATLWRMGPQTMWGHWGYAAPGARLEGEDWPRCAHFPSTTPRDK